MNLRFCNIYSVRCKYFLNIILLLLSTCLTLIYGIYTNLGSFSNLRLNVSAPKDFTYHAGARKYFTFQVCQNISHTKCAKSFYNTLHSKCAKIYYIPSVVKIFHLPSAP